MAAAEEGDGKTLLSMSVMPVSSASSPLNAATATASRPSFLLMADAGRGAGACAVSLLQPLAECTTGHAAAAERGTAQRIASVFQRRRETKKNGFVFSSRREREFDFFSHYFFHQPTHNRCVFFLSFSLARACNPCTRSVFFSRGCVTDERAAFGRAVLRKVPHRA